MAFNSLLNWSKGDIKDAEDLENGASDGPKGIKKEWFVGDEHEIFLCPVCHEVALNPVVASCCEAAFCKECFDATMKCDTDSCKGCNQQFSYGITSSPFQKQLNLLYQRLKLNCCDCHQLLTIKEWTDEHDDCPGKKFNCISCGFNYNLPKGDVHDCIDWLRSEKSKIEKDFKFYKNFSELRIQELEEENQQLKDTFREFLETNGFIGHDKDGNLQLKEPVDKDPKPKTKSVKNVQPKVCPDVQFNEKETIASKEIQVHVSMAVKDMVKSGKKLFAMMPHFREFMRIYVSGQWCLFERSAINSVVNSFNIDPRTFCSFTFDTLKYITFKRVRGSAAEMVKTDPELMVLMARIRSFGRSNSIEVAKDAIDYTFGSSSSSSGDNSRTSPCPGTIVFNEKETFAPKDVRKKVSSAILDISKGKKIDTNFTEVRTFLSQRLNGNWFIHTRGHVDPLSVFVRKIAITTFCSFALDGENYVVFRRASGAESRRRDVQMKDEHHRLVTALLQSSTNNN